MLKSWVRASLSSLLAVIKLCMYGPIQRGSYSFSEINSTHVNLQYFKRIYRCLPNLHMYTVRLAIFVGLIFCGVGSSDNFVGLYFCGVTGLIT